MTKLMQQAIEALRMLPEQKQDELARQLLHDIADDAQWEQSTEKHADAVSRLVADVLEADRRGETEPLDPDKL
ncbi:MAG TPA: hypothetical protein VF669_12945 [Tepidisphaeraceae bacterium]